MVNDGQAGHAALTTDDLKGRIASFMRGASTEITPAEENRLPELKSVLPGGTGVYVAHTPHASFGQVIHAALAVQRAGFHATPISEENRLPELKSVLPGGTGVYVAHTPHASFGQVIHAALAVQRAGFHATP